MLIILPCDVLSCKLILKIEHCEILKYYYFIPSNRTGEYFTKKLIFCQGPRQQLSFFAEEIFGIFKLKLPYFWTICDKNA